MLEGIFVFWHNPENATKFEPVHHTPGGRFEALNPPLGFNTKLGAMNAVKVFVKKYPQYEGKRFFFIEGVRS